MEQVLFRTHVRLITNTCSYFSKTSRYLIEKSLLLLAFTSFILLVLVHFTYVSSQFFNSNCLSQHFDVMNISTTSHNHSPYDIFGIHITDGYSKIYHTQHSIPNEITCPNIAYNLDQSLIFDQYEASSKFKKISLLNLFTSNSNNNIFRWNSLTNTMNTTSNKKSNIIPDTYQEMNKYSSSRDDDDKEEKDTEFDSNSMNNTPNLNYTYLNHIQKLCHQQTLRSYLFSLEKGYLLLSSTAQKHRNITRLDIYIPSNSKCLGPSFIAFMLQRIEAYDTVIKNWMIRSFGGHGYVHNTYSDELYDLNTAADFAARTGNAGSTGIRGTLKRTGGLEHFIAFKIGVILSTILLFFTTTTLVSFTLRVTQEKMLKFTFLLQYHISRRIPYASLVFTHLVESLVFVPLMIGVLFFLTEFFLDQLLAFLTLSLVWLAEVYSVVSLRSRTSMKYFPKVFFAYYSLFHVYFFCFPYGFSYPALCTAVLFLLHAMFCFWNYCEIPAFQAGLITALNPRYGVREDTPATAGAFMTPSTPRNTTRHNDNSANSNTSPRSNGISNAFTTSGNTGNPSNNSIQLNTPVRPTYRRPTIFRLTGPSNQPTNMIGHNQHMSSVHMNTTRAHSPSSSSYMAPNSPHINNSSNNHYNTFNITHTYHTSNMNNSINERHQIETCSRHVELSRRIQHEQMIAIMGLSNTEIGIDLDDMFSVPPPPSLGSSDIQYSRTNDHHNSNHSNNNNMNLESIPINNDNTHICDDHMNSDMITSPTTTSSSRGHNRQQIIATSSDKSDSTTNSRYQFSTPRSGYIYPGNHISHDIYTGDTYDTALSSRTPSQQTQQNHRTLSPPLYTPSSSALSPTYSMHRRIRPFPLTPNQRMNTNSLTRDIPLPPTDVNDRNTENTSSDTESSRHLLVTDSIDSISQSEQDSIHITETRWPQRTESDITNERMAYM